MGAGAGKYTTLSPTTPDSEKADLHEKVVAALAEQGPVKSRRDVEELLRSRGVKVPRRPASGTSRPAVLVPGVSNPIYVGLDHRTQPSWHETGLPAQRGDQAAAQRAGS